MKFDLNFELGFCKSPGNYQSSSPSVKMEQAVDRLMNLFSKADHDLSTVHNQLHREFNRVFPNNVNPMELLARLKKIEAEMASLKVQCRELLTAKQDVIDKARTVLLGNRAILQKLQASAGVPVSCDDDDLAYSSFNEVIDEWSAHVRSTTGNVGEEPDPDDLNQLMFSAIVHGN